MGESVRYQDHEKPFGRPSLYKPEYAEEAYKLTLFGATLPQLAENFGVSTTTIDDWLVEKGDFAGAVKAARVQADSMVELSLYRRALGYEKNGKHYPPDPTSMIFWLKNRQKARWRDTIDHKHSGKVEFKAIERRVIDADCEEITDASEVKQLEDDGDKSS